MWNIVDLFCGTSALSYGMAEKNRHFNVLGGVDLDKDAIETAKKNNKKGTFICDDLSRLSVKEMHNALGGEKVDIVRWYEDPIEQLAEALKPAVPQNVNLDRDKRRMYFEVVEDDLSVAIGRKGINARLTSRLLGWKLDIGKVVVKEVGFDERKNKAAEALTSVGIEFEVADRLVAFGLVSPEAFEGVTAEDLVGLGFEQPIAEDVLSKVSTEISSEE